MTLGAWLRIAAVGLVLALGARAALAAELEVLTIVTDNGSYNFRVELADTPQARQRGLMYREKLPSDQGMLFEFKRTEMQSFWMKNTYIPLDIIFVERSGRIAYIHRNARPRSLVPISSQTPVWAVLELNGGLTSLLGIRIGHQVEHRAFGLSE